jgi:ankyrin repeat protein
MSKALKAAIEANDPDAVRKALKGVKDLNRKIPGANKPLLYACEKGADKVLEILFEAGAIGKTNKSYEGESPFAVAAQHGQTNVMEKPWLLKKASPQAIEHSLDMAAIQGQEEAFCFIIERIKPPITGKIFRLASKQKRSFVEVLVKNGGDINAKEDAGGEKSITAFHAAAHNGNPAKMQILAECGANVNVRDPIGRTPLMMLAAQLEWHERRESAEIAMQALETILALGADASATDNFGNDAIAYCEFAYGRSVPNQTFIERLRKAGASGCGATGRLFAAIRNNDISEMQQAIKEGADVNHVCPFGSTPLIWGDKSEEMVDLLLQAGADPNKSGTGETPLVSAAGSGNLQVVKKLIAAGADIHTVHESGDFINNAYSAATGNGKYDVADYLKSLGAGNPKPAKSEPLKPGVKSWNDFSELLVKSSVEKAAEALAKMIKGKVQLNVYGQSLLPGKQAFVVVRPNGMDWCNVFQIAPQRDRFEDSKKTEIFAREFAKVSGVPVLSIEYSDTSDAAGVFRAEPDGKSTRDDGWDRDTLEEMVGAMGDKAPAWARKQLAKTDEDEPSSTEKLEMLAEREKFVAAAFGLDCEPGRKVDVDFAGYGADTFDGVAFVSS